MTGWLRSRVPVRMRPTCATRWCLVGSCWESVTWNSPLADLKTGKTGSVGDPWHFGADPDPTPDPTPFFSDFKDVKKIIFFIFFSYNLPKGTWSSGLNFIFVKFLLKFYFARISVRLTPLWEKGRIRTGSIPLTNGSGSGRHKNMQIGNDPNPDLQHRSLASCCGR